MEGHPAGGGLWLLLMTGLIVSLSLGGHFAAREGTEDGLWIMALGGLVTVVLAWTFIAGCQLLG